MENMKDSIKENVKKVIETAKKIYKCRILLKLGMKGLTVGATAYSLVPKYEKIEGIDTDKLVATHMNKYDL